MATSVGTVDMKIILSVLVIACSGCSHLVSEEFDRPHDSDELEPSLKGDSAAFDTEFSKSQKGGSSVSRDAAGHGHEEPAENLRLMFEAIDRLTPLHARPSKPEPGDWLSRHNEPGQTFREYLQADAVTPTGKRSVIYIQPLGGFSDQQRQIVELSAEYLEIYMNRSVRILDDLPLSIIPEHAQRTHPDQNVDQILTTYVLNGVLRPRLPIDAAAYIAFTATDLWPGRDWSFVFGQASLQHRVGVWSIYRNGVPSKNAAEYVLCLRRTLKTATHETGHMFSMRHCTAYECNMRGSNHREESDRYPLYLCPECHAKVTWATGANSSERYRRLAEFCRKHGLTDERAYFERAITALGE